jgi:hypothetical protein
MTKYYSHELHKDIFANNGPHMMLVPYDYNEAETFLSHSDIVAISVIHAKSVSYDDMIGLCFYHIISLF